MLIVSLTILLGALLLFQVELIIGKCILPWFGGSSAVWITCMLFFQVMLLGGYAYGHILQRARPRRQSLFHCLLLLTSVLTLVGQLLIWHSTLILDSRWKPLPHGNPALQIVTLLAVSVGLPFLVLASTAPLLQSWWRQRYPGRSPYRLYAVSNFGSFLGLVSYPFLVEPFLHLKTQAQLWSWGYAVFAIGCSYCALLARGAPEGVAEGSSGPRESAVGPGQGGRPGAGQLILWLSLAACASVMFLATTNQLCKNVAPVPLLWVLPLAVYLLTFTLCFESESRYSRKWFHPAFALALVMACVVLASTGVRENLWVQIGVYSFVLFAGCMFCHGELARLKPDPGHLTLFYLIVAAGGTLGGLFVGLAAPSLFRGYWEYEISLWLSASLFLLVLFRDRSSWLYSTRIKSPVLIVSAAALVPGSTAFAFGSQQLLTVLPFVIMVVAVLIVLKSKHKPPTGSSRKFMIMGSCWIALLILGATLITLAKGPRDKIAVVRNFYGVLTLAHRNPADPALAGYALLHGEIVHGFEFRSPGKQLIPTSYYTRDSGLGLVLANRSRLMTSVSDRAPQSLRIGIVGLGIGTIAAYGNRGDYMRFYELNPQVVRLASDTRYFHYLEACPARIDIVLGDARFSLEQELNQGVRQDFDLLVIDAFSGDAIPIHLLTEEAFQLYFNHVKNPGGILAVHITNTLLDLRPVVMAAAERLKLYGVWVHEDGDERISSTSDWVLVSRDRGAIDVVAASAKHAAKLQIPEGRLWTDDYSNLFQALGRSAAATR